MRNNPSALYEDSHFYYPSNDPDSEMTAVGGLILGGATIASLPLAAYLAGPRAAAIIHINRVRLGAMLGAGTAIVKNRDGSIDPQRPGAPLAASPTRTTPPQSGGKREAPQRASGDAKHRRAHKCPKGHYWSYKHKKCMKSKF